MTAAGGAGRRGAWWPALISLAGGAALCFLAGAFAYGLGWAPAAPVRRAIKAHRALEARRGLEALDALPENWVSVPDGPPGLRIHDPQLASVGYTLVVTAAHQETLMLDMAGEVVHRWACTWREAFPRPAHVEHPVAGVAIAHRQARVLPDGRLVVVWETTRDTPYGYGMAMLDREGRPLWALPERVHHDLELTEAGTILAIAQRFRPTDMAGAFEGQVLDDELLEVSLEGAVLRRLSVMDLLRGTHAEAALRLLVQAGSWDPLHTNSVSELRGPGVARLATVVPGVEEGQALVCLRNLGLLAAVDLAAGRVRFLPAGPWQMPHDPSLLPSGNLLILDNLGDPGGAQPSRALEFDPAAGAIRWSYSGGPGQPFGTFAKGHVQRLPNGNTLIDEGMRSRVFEVTPGGEVVWEWVSAPAYPGGPHSSVLNTARRYAPEEVPFLAASADVGGSAGPAG